MHFLQSEYDSCSYKSDITLLILIKIGYEICLTNTRCKYFQLFVTSPLIEYEHIILILVEIYTVQQEVVIQIMSNKVLQSYPPLISNRLHLHFIYYLHYTLQFSIVLIDQLTDVWLTEFVSVEIVMVVEFFIV